MYRATFTALLLVVTFVSNPASAVGNFQSGNWRGQAYFNGSRFTHCAMSAGYDSGWRLIFTMQRDGNVVLGMSHQGLNLTKGNSANVLMQIDSSPIIERRFTALSARLIATTFTSNVEWFQRLRRGLSLKVRFGKNVRSFSLRGTNNALLVLFACARRYRNA